MHDVIAAITIEPSRKRSAACEDGELSVTATSAATAVPPPPSPSSRAIAAGATLRAVRHSSSAISNAARAPFNGTRSCGRLGPARFGSTVERSSPSVSVKRGSSDASVRNIPCAFAYASISATCSALRPVSFKYVSVCSSIGKIAIVEPYSGDMLPIVVRTATGKLLKPAP